MIPLALFSVLALWKPNPVLFLINAGIAVMTGLEYFNLYVSNQGLAVSLMIIAYSIYCIAMAFRMIFWGQDSDG